MKDMIEQLGLSAMFNEQIAGITPPQNPREPNLAENIEATPVPWVCTKQNIRGGTEI